MSCIIEHVRKCMKIYCFIQEIIFVSLRKPSALIPNCHTLRSNFFFPTSNPRFQVFSELSQMPFLLAKEPTMVLSFTLRYSQNNAWSISLSVLRKDLLLKFWWGSYKIPMNKLGDIANFLRWFWCATFSSEKYSIWRRINVTLWHKLDFGCYF